MSAGDWIKMRTNLAEDPRVKAIAAQLRIRDSDLVVGKLHRLWSYADTYSIDGTVPLLFLGTIDKICRLKNFASTLVQVGWLEVNDSGVVIPRFDKHNSNTAKRRALESVRKMSARDADRSRTHSGQFAHLEKNKKREDKEHTQRGRAHGSNGCVPDPTSTDPVALIANDPDFGSAILDPALFVSQIRAAFPDLDLLEVLHAAHRWRNAGGVPQAGWDKCLRGFMATAAGRDRTRASPRNRLDELFAQALERERQYDAGGKA